jgi:hypothetical protein
MASASEILVTLVNIPFENLWNFPSGHKRDINRNIRDSTKEISNHPKPLVPRNSN